VATPAGKSLLIIYILKDLFITGKVKKIMRT
jgi:hypothetical protein